MSEQVVKNPRDKWIPWYFVMFFAVIAVVDGFFVYMAVSTHTGVVTEKPYERGLAYNELLEQAREQQGVQQKASYKDGILRWALAEQDGAAIESAHVTAKIVRPVQAGHDFDIELMHKGSGVYEARPPVPLLGAWTAKLSSTWDDRQYQREFSFIAE